MLIIAWVLVGASALYWLMNLAGVVRVVWVVPQLRDLSAAALARPPRLTHVIPACNEAAALEDAVKSRLADGYPNVELVLVDDRSTDETGAVADRLAGGDERIRVLHVRELPAGWLGKVHALHVGVGVARGEWLLFSDADVHLRPGTLARAIGYCEAQQLDHLALFPELWDRGPLLSIVLAGFIRIFCLATRAWSVSPPERRAAVGVGAFNLVRRSAFERTPGFEWLRMEVVDDLALGQMLMRHGARVGIASGRGLVGLTWYGTLGAMARGAEKSVLPALGRFRLWRLALLCGLVLVLELSVFAGILAYAEPALQGVAAGGACCAVAAQVIPSVWQGRPVWPALVPPVATILSVGLALRAGWLAVRRGGLMWRGTLYPTEQLRQGSRLEFP